MRGHLRSFWLFVATLVVLAAGNPAIRAAGISGAKGYPGQPSPIDELCSLVTPNKVYTEYVYSAHDSDCEDPVETSTLYLGVCAPDTNGGEFVSYSCENAVLTKGIYSDPTCKHLCDQEVTFLTTGCTPAYEQERDAGDGALSFSACLSANSGNESFPNATVNATCGITPTLPGQKTCPDCQVHLQVFSAGFKDGNTGAAYLDGVEVSGKSAGWHALCIDEESLTVKAADVFNLYDDPDQNDAFNNFLLEDCQAGDILVLYVVDDGATNLSPEVKDTLFVSYGAADLDSLTFRASYILVSRKGQEGSKCILNSVGFYEERSCDIHPPNGVFAFPAAVTRFVDETCEQAYQQSVWPVNTCTSGSEQSSLTTCVSTGTLQRYYDDDTCNDNTGEITYSTNGCSQNGETSYTSTCGVSIASPRTGVAESNFTTNTTYYVEYVFTAHDVECEEPLQVDAWYLGVCAPTVGGQSVFQLGCGDGEVLNYTYSGTECIDDNLLSITVFSHNASHNASANSTLPDCSPDLQGFLRVGVCTDAFNISFEAARISFYPQSNCSHPYFETAVEENHCLISEDDSAYTAVCDSADVNVFLGTSEEVCTDDPSSNEVATYQVGTCSPVQHDEQWPVVVHPAGYYLAHCDSAQAPGFHTDTSLYIQYVYDTDDDSCGSQLAANIWHLGVCTPTSQGTKVKYGCSDNIFSVYTFTGESNCEDPALLSVQAIAQINDTTQCVKVGDDYRIDQECVNSFTGFDDDTTLGVYTDQCEENLYFETIHKEGKCVPVKNQVYLTTDCDTSDGQLKIYVGQQLGGSCLKTFQVADVDLKDCSPVPSNVGQFLAYSDLVGNWYGTCARSELPGDDTESSSKNDDEGDASPPTAATSSIAILLSFMIVLLFAM